MKTKQEEADTMVVQQEEEVKAKKVIVVADDTDIIIYLFFCFTYVANRPLSRRLDRCDRVIQDEVGDSNGGNV